METPVIEQLQRFILLNELKREDGIILFDATVKCYKSNTFLKLDSQIQVIQLPNETAVYIVEFFKEEYHEPEMYSTAHYTFNCPDDQSLEITDESTRSRILISLIPQSKI